MKLLESVFRGKNIIGLDIGGTKINGIVYNNGKILKELTIVTPKSLYAFEKNLLKLVDFLSAKHKIHGIGVAMAGGVDSHLGIVRNSPNMKFVNNLNLIKFFHLNKVANVKIDNDANCFTRAELELGVGKSFKNFIVLTLGTGIGGGIVINRHIYRGEHNAGGELGHIVSSGQYLETEFKKARDGRDNKALGKILGQAFATYVNIFAPQAIILGGGVSTDKTRDFIKLAEKEMNKFLFTKSNNTKIIVSKLKNAGAIGAALLIK